MWHNSCKILFIAAYVLHALFISSLPSFLMQLKLRCTSTLLSWTVRCIVCVSATVLTVADGAQSVIVFHTLTDDPPLGEHGVGADGTDVNGAPGSQQVVGADVALTASDGKVPVGQGEGWVAQHVLHRWNNKGRVHGYLNRFMHVFHELMQFNIGFNCLCTFNSSSFTPPSFSYYFPPLYNSLPAPPFSSKIAFRSVSISSNAHALSFLLLSSFLSPILTSFIKPSA